MPLDDKTQERPSPTADKENALNGRRRMGHQEIALGHSHRNHAKNNHTTKVTTETAPGHTFMQPHGRHLGDSSQARPMQDSRGTSKKKKRNNTTIEQKNAIFDTHCSVFWMQWVLRGKRYNLIPTYVSTSIQTYLTIFHTNMLKYFASLMLTYLHLNS